MLKFTFINAMYMLQKAICIYMYHVQLHPLSIFYFSVANGILSREYNILHISLYPMNRLIQNTEKIESPNNAQNGKIENVAGSL